MLSVLLFDVTSRDAKAILFGDSRDGLIIALIYGNASCVLVRCDMIVPLKWNV